MGDVRAMAVRRILPALVLAGVLSAVVSARAQALTADTRGATPAVLAATLFGYVDASVVPTEWAFAYGPTTDYGNWSPTTVIAPETGATLVAAQLTGLTPDTTYHYRLVVAPAFSSQLDPTAGIAGDDASFTTQAEQLHLDSPALLAPSGTARITLQCESATTCAGELVLRARPAAGQRSTTCAQTSVRLASWLDRTLAVKLSSGCLALLKSARGHGVTGSLTASLSSGQLGFSSPVLLSRR